MQNSEVDIIKVLESKFGSKVQIQPGLIGTAAISTNGLHREVLKAMVEADAKTGITAITGLDLGANLGVILSRSHRKGLLRLTS